jgi:DNA-binding NtrC family response regulator
VESELFGHRRGAFTGADEHRAGLFEVADGGTLFLDEIGELPLALQSRLLRVLESGEIRRVGDNHPIMVDVRVVCATHRSLEAMVADGSFREDLLFRINTFEIETPPLRERLDDLPLLVDHFVRLRRPQAPPQAEVVSSTALKLLQRHRWPGNIRELANCIEHAVVLCDELPLRPEHLPARICRAAASTGERSQPAEETQLAAEAPGFQPASDRPQSLRELEMQAILAGLDRNGGNKSRTAEELGISLKTLYNKLNQLNDAAAEQAAA